ncbi:proto-oncogene tyrosine-protein kinase receptor Ret isoform X1 [Harpegnathos saltator]|uniref:proto-oncogene tyrosine-protein kinase receptor Ret isoform X1 n=1 Tax=Harpegnathos saltator TaxID=610380 RepID=UPI000DBED723|nr:proto-oncogene tyrosine-protein kinase receptor Ret isoform X1 [Harpegnathos saltator]
MVGKTMCLRLEDRDADYKNGCRDRGRQLVSRCWTPERDVPSPLVQKVGLYFPQSNLTLRLPYLAQHGAAVLPRVKLVDLRTLRDDSTTPKNVEYRLRTDPQNFAIQQENSSNIVLQSLPVNGTGSIIVEASETSFDKAVLDILVQPVAVTTKTIDCTDFLQDMCFWNTSIYKIYENQPVTMIGTFGPEAYGYVCPEFNVTRYELLNGTKYFHAVDGMLFANASLDRDILDTSVPHMTSANASLDQNNLSGPGPLVMVEVNCVIWETSGRQYTQTKVIAIDILDEDDNPPSMQGNNSIVKELEDFSTGATLINTLILSDADAMTTNRYNVLLLGDTHNAFRISHQTLPIEHSKHHPNKAPFTVIVVSIDARKTLLPKSPYNVTIQAIDESLLPRYGPNTANISVSFTGPVHRISTTKKSSSSAPTTLEPVLFPTSVMIARLSPRYFRVTEQAVNLWSSRTFVLNGSSAFDVTQRSGIVYVSNETLLRSEPATILLKLKWGEEKRAEWTLQVNLIDVPPSKGNNTCRLTQEMHSCANARSRDKCVQSCGIASGALSNGSFAGQCVWRSNDRNNGTSQMSESYSTCSPNLAYCPDNKCDELERSDPRICPQDCIVESDVHFAHIHPNGRGIKSGLGTCACSDLPKCTCGLDAFRHVIVSNAKEKRLYAGKLRDRKNEVVASGTRKASSNPCGPTCMMGVIGASLFVLIVIVGSFVMWRYRRAAKGARRECKHRVDDAANGIGILPSDYIDRGDGLLIGLDTFTTANRHLLLPKTCPPDPKWEFPRSRLTIEQVLGEGEFGRVLRAKAIDIGGWSGPTTVAVKTLKEDACASELADLLSEYQLLKEAQHPNVIRLLGACTTPGAPVYLIIEFAEFGSLRNYLRRSRNLKTEGRTGCSTSLLSASSGNNTGEESRCADNALTYTITPHDILSFAWQISKGMAYLADIKLVHRDLAARNVLLATGKVCKISDFGLTRDVYEDDAYLKRSKGRVPVKWMAPESLADHVYTSKSDVWSFGVLLWELVTLGASPYPGVDVHNLYNLLKSGYRMERPVNCSQQLYKLMMSCWHLEPGMRPSFKELTCHWERMLEDGIEYLDLNPRTVHNQAYFESLHSLDKMDDSDDNETVSNLKTDTVNYLGRMSSEPVTKCDKVDKLQALWQMSIASFPEEPVKSSYVNDRPASLNANHYESPIKLRNTSVTSNSENDLRICSQERPQSYIDMQGKKSTETEDLLMFGSMDDDRSDNNVTN